MQILLRIDRTGQITIIGPNIEHHLEIGGLTDTDPIRILSPTGGAIRATPYVTDGLPGFGILVPMAVTERFDIVHELREPSFYETTVSVPAGSKVKISRRRAHVVEEVPAAA